MPTIIDKSVQNPDLVFLSSLVAGDWFYLEGNLCLLYTVMGSYGKTYLCLKFVEGKSPEKLRYCSSGGRINSMPQVKPVTIRLSKEA